MTTDQAGHDGRGRAVLSVLARRDAVRHDRHRAGAGAVGHHAARRRGRAHRDRRRRAARGAAVARRPPARRASRCGAPAGACLAGSRPRCTRCASSAASRARGSPLGTLVTIGSGPVFTGLLSWLLLRERPRLSWVVATSVCVVGLALLDRQRRLESGDVDLARLLLALASGLGLRRLHRRVEAADERRAPQRRGDGGCVRPRRSAARARAPHPAARVARDAERARDGAVARPRRPPRWPTCSSAAASRHLPAGPVTTLVLAEPVVATVLGVVVLGETIPLLGWVGVGCVLAGLALQGVGVASVG